MPTSSQARSVRGRRDLVRAATRHPYFAHKYRHLDLDDDFDFTDVPEMTRDDVTASTEAASTATSRPGSAYLLTSGGSTAEPKLAWAPSDMYVGALLPHWQPLTARDVLANLAMPGRLWSAHYFYNRVAEHAGAAIIGLGHIPDDAISQWLAFLHRLRTSALACTPSQLSTILRHCEERGHPLLQQLRSVIWFGEPCDTNLLELRRRYAPQLGLWGNYGSTETMVVGYNGPGCATDTFHVLSHHYVEIVEGGVLVTSGHPSAVIPVIRYRIGDRGSFEVCRCGRGGVVLRVLGREDSSVKFAGTLVDPQELVAVARSIPQVHAAQVALIADGRGREVLEVRVVGDARELSHHVLRTRLLEAHVDLRFALRGDEEAFRVALVERLQASAHTGKTPSLIRERTA